MYENLNKRAIGCMMINEIITAVIVTAIILCGKVYLGDKYVPELSWVFYAVIAVSWVMMFIAPFVRYRRYRYRFTDEEIDVKEGFLFVQEDIVPIERLQKVALASGPVDRVFGLSKVIVTTAGGEVTIRFLEEDKARKIADRLKNRINQYGKQSHKQEQDQQIKQEQQGQQQG